MLARGKRDGGGGEQRGGEAGNVEELAGAVERGLDLGPALFGRQPAHALGPLDRLGGGDGLGAAGELQRVAGAAAERQQTTRGQVRRVDEHAWRELGEAAAAVGFVGDQGFGLEREIAEREGRIEADLQILQDACVEPGLAGWRDACHRFHRAEGFAAELEHAAARVALADRLHRDQAGAIASRSHAREAGHRRGLQTLGLEGREQRLGDRIATAQQRVAAERVAALAFEREPHALGEEPDAAGRRDREHERREQDQQAAGSCAAREAAQGMPQRLSHAACPPRAAARVRNVRRAPRRASPVRASRRARG